MRYPGEKFFFPSATWHSCDDFVAALLVFSSYEVEKHHSFTVVLTQNYTSTTGGAVAISKSP